KMPRPGRILLPKSSPEAKSHRSYEICGLGPLGHDSVVVTKRRIVEDDGGLLPVGNVSTTFDPSYCAKSGDWLWCRHIQQWLLYASPCVNCTRLRSIYAIKPDKPERPQMSKSWLESQQSKPVPVSSSK